MPNVCGGVQVLRADVLTAVAGPKPAERFHSPGSPPVVCPGCSDHDPAGALNTASCCVAVVCPRPSLVPHCCSCLIYLYPAIIYNAIGDCNSLKDCRHGSSTSGRQTMPCRGWTVSVTQVLLMASPLSGLLRAIQQRSSANFHLGVCAMGLLRSSLWAIYAMVRSQVPCH